jgi:hypothetical protein
MLVTCNFEEGAPARAHLVELKTLHVGPTTYTNNEDRCAAVARRARRIPCEYHSKARHIDETICGAPRGTAGPVSLKLRSLGDIRSLVFGAFGEAASDVERLLGAAADAGAQNHRMSMGAKDPVEARAALVWLLRRRWGLAALRANARLTIDRLEFVGRGAVAAADRRTDAATRWQHRCRQDAICARNGPSGSLHPRVLL